MFPSLFKSDKLLKELNAWAEQANNISNENLKKRILEKISFVRKKADEIDVAHNSNYNGFIKPHLMADTRLEINKARAEIKKLLNNA